MVRLPLHFGDKVKAKNLEVDFLVVDVPTAYNIILGQPTLHKFEADDGSVGTMQRDQRTAQECYLVSIHPVIERTNERGPGDPLTTGTKPRTEPPPPPPLATKALVIHTMASTEPDSSEEERPDHTIQAVPTLIEGRQARNGNYNIRKQKNKTRKGYTSGSPSLSLPTSFAAPWSSSSLVPTSPSKGVVSSLSRLSPLTKGGLNSTCSGSRPSASAC
ncbi:hypothetical protein Cgig2_000156 [Carnegiea gigantea]|uniref:Uncharacterized protein n=1 Tax=Carnegiea gigantea TaxID=171969 RepID=A0A9Q1JRV4_9CARY|nr:hypothetical protein Cgig2_000156 [Carnegiea gigantea]